MICKKVTETIPNLKKYINQNIDRLELDTIDVISFAGLEDLYLKEIVITGYLNENKIDHISMSTSLEKIIITGSALPSLFFLKNLKKLKNISISNTNIPLLDGIEKLKIQQLNLINLTDLNNIDIIPSSVKTLCLNHNSLDNYDVIKDLKISSLIAYNENINYDFLDNHNTIKVLGIKTKNAKDCLDNVRIEYLNTLILKDFGVNITKHDINLSNILRNFPNIIALNGESINKYPDYQQISRNIKLEKILAF